MVFIALIYVLALFISNIIYGNHIKETIKNNNLKRYMVPLGLLILNATGYKFNSAYDLKILTLIKILRGNSKAKYNLYIFTAYKISLVLLLWAIMSIIYLSTKDIYVFVFIVILSCCVFILQDKELERNVENKKRQIVYDMGDFLDKLILLVNTGMTLTAAWEKAEKGNKEGPFYQELKKIRRKINTGTSFNDALEEFSLKMSIPQISKFISLIVQNTKKGNEEISFLLRQYILEYWNLRKSMVKKIGEEAAVKMIIPMMLIFGVVLIIIMFPALTYFKL